MSLHFPFIIFGLSQRQSMEFTCKVLRPLEVSVLTAVPLYSPDSWARDAEHWENNLQLRHLLCSDLALFILKFQSKKFKPGKTYEGSFNRSGVGGTWANISFMKSM